MTAYFSLSKFLGNKKFPNCYGKGASLAGLAHSEAFFEILEYLFWTFNHQTVDLGENVVVLVMEDGLVSLRLFIGFQLAFTHLTADGIPFVLHCLHFNNKFIVIIGGAGLMAISVRTLLLKGVIDAKAKNYGHDLILDI